MDYESKYHQAAGDQDEAYSPNPPPYRGEAYPPHAPPSPPARGYLDVRRPGPGTQGKRKWLNQGPVVVLMAGVLFALLGTGLLGVLAAAGWFQPRTNGPVAGTNPGANNPWGGANQNANNPGGGFNPNANNPGGGFNQETTVHIDNYSFQDVSIELDGKPWQTANQGTTRTATMTRGGHQVVVKDARTQAELDRLTVQADNYGPYILNVLGAQSYLRGTAHYDRMPRFGGMGELPPVNVTDRWIYANVDCLFQDPPRSISLPQYATTGTRTYLIRGFRQPAPLFNPPGGNNPGFNPPGGNNPLPPPAPTGETD